MSLLERLSPEHLQMIKNHEVLYPFSAKSLQNDLLSTNHWVDLKYSTIVLLNSYIDYSDYTPTGMDKLFGHGEH